MTIFTLCSPPRARALKAPIAKYTLGVSLLRVFDTIGILVTGFRYDTTLGVSLLRVFDTIGFEESVSQGLPNFGLTDPSYPCPTLLEHECSRLPCSPPCTWEPSPLVLEIIDEYTAAVYVYSTSVYDVHSPVIMRKQPTTHVRDSCVAFVRIEA
jgi:hypothetical protein